MYLPKRGERESALLVCLLTCPAPSSWKPPRKTNELLTAALWCYCLRHDAIFSPSDGPRREGGLLNQGIEPGLQIGVSAVVVLPSHWYDKSH